MAFATEAELEDYLGGTDVPTGQATLLLDLATGTIRAWTEQNISPAEQTTRTFRNTSAYRLPLPHPVAIPITVDSVVEDGTTLDAADYRLEPTHHLVKTGGKAWKGDVEVTYTHGSTEAPNAVKAVTLSLAARAVGNPAGTQSIKIGDYSETFTSGAATTAGVTGVELSEADKHTLTPYHLTQAG